MLFTYLKIFFNIVVSTWNSSCPHNFPQIFRLVNVSSSWKMPIWHHSVIGMSANKALSRSTSLHMRWPLPFIFHADPCSHVHVFYSTASSSAAHFSTLSVPYLVLWLKQGLRGYWNNNAQHRLSIYWENKTSKTAWQLFLLKLKFS